LTTTITAGNGAAAGPLWTLGGIGSTPGYNAIDDRRAASAGLQEGAYAAQSFEVTQRGAGANMSVDIAASTHEQGIAAYVQGDSISGQGLYMVHPHSAVINEAIGTAHATLPRVDRVILEVLDNQHDSGGASLARTRVVAGTATAGATLDNLNGAAAVPNSALLLADVLIAATDTSIGNAEIRDRRKWARGAYSRITRNTGGPLSTASSTQAEMDATNIKPRVECTGVSIRVTLECDVQLSVGSDKAIGFDLFVDGVAQSLQRRAVLPTATLSGRGFVAWDLTPAAGSHRIAPGFASVDGVTTMQVLTSATEPLVFTVEEVLRPVYANNTLTSG
jgi:hypothetical protein